MCLKKKLYFCTIFIHTYMHKRRTVTTKKHIGWGLMTLVMCLLVPVFSYAQAQRIVLGTNVSNAPAVEDTVYASVVDGTENYFKIYAEHLPATVCYFSDSVFGPIPVLVNVVGMDTLLATQVLENCRAGWRWELGAAAEDEDIRYLYFSAHENGATAEFRPFVCHTSYISLPDTTVCDEYVWEDTTIVDSDIYTRAFKTAAGCDSIVTQKVTVSSTTVGYDRISAYDSYTWMDGQTYTRSTTGGHVWQISNVAGCDSIVNLILTIRHLAVNDTVRETVCLAAGESYTWRGKTYTTSGLYSTDTLPGSEEIDGIWMDTLHTLNLTVNRTYAVDTTVAVCATEYTWRGTTYTQSGNYPFNGKTKALCDSIVTLHLTLKQATSEEIYKTIYEGESYVGICGEYFKSGDYTCIILNAAGCDSTIILHLTTQPKPVHYDTIESYFCSKSGIIEHVDTTADPRIWYKPYSYVKPQQEVYMANALTNATNEGAYVNFRKIEQNLDAYYVEPLMPVTAIFWRYQPRGQASLEDLIVEANQPQWVATGTVSLEVQFFCGQRYYGSFTVGDMDQALDQTQNAEIPVKRIENGQVIILRNGAKYNLLGTKIQ